MKKQTTLIAITCVIITVGVLLFLTSTNEPSESDELKVITASYVPAGFYAPVLLADKLNLFEKYGYQLELKRYNDNGIMVSSFVNGQLDITAQSAFSMFRVNEKHPDTFKFLYGQYANSYFFLTSSENENIKSVNDLKGKTIGTWQSPTATTYIQLIAANSGLADENYNVVRFPVSEVANQLIAGNVDAVFTFDLQAAFLTESGNYKYVEKNAQSELLGSDKKAFNGGAMISLKSIEKDPKKLSAAKSALSDAINFINDKPVVARELLAEILNINISSPENIYLDEFFVPTKRDLGNVDATQELLKNNQVLDKKVESSALFFIEN